MGVGDPASLVEAVALGVDQFDCVLPTRLGRHGTALTGAGKAAPAERPATPLERRARSTRRARCPVCARHTRGYLRHLFQVGEPTASPAGHPAQRGLDAARCMDRMRGRRSPPARFDAFRARGAGRLGLTPQARVRPAETDPPVRTRLLPATRSEAESSRSDASPPSTDQLADSDEQRVRPVAELAFPLLLVAMYFLLIRPQRRARAAGRTRACAASLEVGDEVHARRRASTASSPASTATTSSGWRSPTTSQIRCRRRAAIAAPRSTPRRGQRRRRRAGSNGDQSRRRRRPTRRPIRRRRRRRGRTALTRTRPHCR